MNFLATLVSVLVGAFLGYFFSRLAQRLDLRRGTYEDANRFLADYRVRAMGCGTPQELLIQSVWLNRQIADQFSKDAFEAWRAVHNFLEHGGLAAERSYEFDQARDH